MNPIVPLGLGAVALLLFTSKKEAHAAPYSQAPPPSGATTTPALAPSPEPRPAAKTTAEMPEALKQQMATALGKLGVHPFTGELSGAADAEAIRFGTQTVGQLESQGYYQAAADLRKYVNAAAAKVPTPKEGKPIAANAPIGLTQAQKDHVARVLMLERSPAVLGTFITWLKTLPPSKERDSTIQTAQAIRLQILEAQSTAETLQKIDQVIKSPGLPQVQAAAKPAAPLPQPQPAVPTPPPAPPPPATTKALPEQPTVVPAKPQPQPMPRQLTAAEKAALDLTRHLATIQARYGGPKQARSKMDLTLVKRAQRALGTKDDGKPGPSTFVLAAGKGAVELPLVMFWPRSANAAYVSKYRDSLGRIAAKFESLGKAADANSLRMSAARERGQGGIVGPLLS